MKLYRVLTFITAVTMFSVTTLALETSVESRPDLAIKEVIIKLDKKQLKESCDDFGCFDTTELLPNPNISEELLRNMISSTTVSETINVDGVKILLFCGINGCHLSSKARTREPTIETEQYLKAVDLLEETYSVYIIY